MYIDPPSIVYIKHLSICKAFKSIRITTNCTHNIVQRNFSQDFFFFQSRWRKKKSRYHTCHTQKKNPFHHKKRRSSPLNCTCEVYKAIELIGGKYLIAFSGWNDWITVFSIFVHSNIVVPWSFTSWISIDAFILHNINKEKNQIVIWRTWLMVVTQHKLIVI